MTKAAVGQSAEKKEEKVEKRRALGRGLESLLPGPRVVASTESLVASAEDRVPSTEPEEGKSPPFDSLRAGSFANSAKDGAPAESTGFLEPAASLGHESQEIGGRRTEPALSLPKGVSAPHEHLPHEHLADEHIPHEAIEIQAAAGGRIPGNLVMNVAVEAIEKNPYQTRYHFDEEMLGELAASIRQNGVVQPIVVRPAAEEGKFVLILGERRLRASKLAGKETIPAIVRRVSEQQAAEMTVVENLQRQDLNCLEQAEAFRVLSKEFRLTQAQIGERIGVSRETVSNYMRLLKLPQEVMNYVLEERLSFSDARLILALEDEKLVAEVAKEVVEKHLKWDEIEELVMRRNGDLPPGPGQEKKSLGARWVDPNVRAAQTDMERVLGVKVKIQDRNGKGKIVIEYATVDDYQRVVEMLRGKGK